MTQNRPDGLDGSVPLQHGGGVRLPNLYTEPLREHPQRDTTTPAAELEFDRLGMTPFRWCHRCGLMIADEGQEIHRQHHVEMTELGRAQAVIVAHLVEVTYGLARLPLPPAIVEWLEKYR